MTGAAISRKDIDFTIARGLPGLHVIESVYEVFQQEGPGTVEVSRETLNKYSSDDTQLSKRDAECLFTGLVLNDAASESAKGKSFAEYSFEIDTERAKEVLQSQYIARQALDEVGFSEDSSVEERVELLGTFPPAMGTELPTNVRPIAGDLRRIFFEADSEVRIASPYFDPSPSVIGDIVGLVNRGVQTKVLTRETESADRNLRLTLNRLYQEIDSSYRDHLRVRDLYEQDDQTGRHAYATHAKIAIADREVCYLGSANLTDTSLTANFELGVLLRDDIVTTAIEVFDTVFEFARPVDLPL